jgi:hypothetical protein
MKLYRKDFRIYTDLIYILPAVVLVFNDPIYVGRNFAIEFRWLAFHARLLWLKESD